MNCPVDGTELMMTDRNGIEIDYCPRCRGVWLDRGELDKLIERSVGQMPVTSAPMPPRREGYPTGYDDDDRKPKNEDRYDDDDARYGQSRRKKSFLGEMFDIF